MGNLLIVRSPEIVCQLKTARRGVVNFNDLIRIADTPGADLQNPASFHLQQLGDDAGNTCFSIGSRNADHMQTGT